MRSGLTSEEREILEAFERGALERAEDAGSIQQRHRDYAEETPEEETLINIRLSLKDLRSLQQKALAEGIPCQTLIASILHKYVEGRLREYEGNT